MSDHLLGASLLQVSSTTADKEAVAGSVGMMRKLKLCEWSRESVTKDEVI